MRHLVLITEILIHEVNHLHRVGNGCLTRTHTVAQKVCRDAFDLLRTRVHTCRPAIFINFRDQPKAEYKTKICMAACFGDNP